VGIKALDAHTLEVQLLEPVAYFPFIVTLPVTLPLPRPIIERYGESWWQPGKIISNGPFRLVEFDPQRGGVVERAANYPGWLSGNIKRIEWTVEQDSGERLRAYQENRVDFTTLPPSVIPESIPKGEIIFDHGLAVVYLILPPLTPPLSNPGVRKAFGLTFDRQSLFEKYQLPIARGGLVPPGMPGHTPDIGLPFDIELGRSLLAEAGFPGGRGFPKLTVIAPIAVFEYVDELKQMWLENLGIELDFIIQEPQDLDDWSKIRETRPLMINGWIADYPDPDNFLRQSDMITRLKYLGWQDADYDRLVEEAARMSDRPKRMAMYRQADRWLVEEQALVLPIAYGPKQAGNLVKPWVKSRDPTLIGLVMLQNIIIEEH